MDKRLSNKKTLAQIFFFTGLGADERAFSQLEVQTSLPKIHVAWLKPQRKETLPAYCRRLIKHYKIKNGDVLIGLSFGGLVVTEINKLIKPALSILISSVSTRKELPLLYRIAGRLNLHNLIPKSSLNKPNRLKYYFFSLKKPAQKQLFDDIITDADPDFDQWAIEKIVHWKNSKRPENLYKINGSSDRIIPVRKASSDFVIEGGSHFLTWENADAVSEIIRQLLEKNGFETKK
ncbi:MAG: hypothetical protein IEMM0006_0099 [bacterium]|nr:MAG: hypothetical protein IEMM0006_0099 [bacterium]